METNATNTTISQNEKLLYSQFRRKINAEAARAQIRKLEYDLADVRSGLNALKTACQDANALQLGAVCVMPCFVRQCAAFLGKNKKSSLVACINQPTGGDVTDIKVKAVKRAVKDGADEVDVAAPVAHVREANYAYVRKEFRKLRSAAKTKSLRIALDCTLLTREEIIRVCSVAADCRVNCIKLAGISGADRIADVKTAVKDKCTIKSEGAASVLEMSGAVDLGATVVGSRNAADVARAIMTAADTEL